MSKMLKAVVAPTDAEQFKLLSINLHDLPAFPAFWLLYPKKTHRAAAVKMWDKLKPHEKIAAIRALPAHVRLWERERRDQSKIPNPATWLNPTMGRRWEDELPAEPEQVRSGFRSAKVAL
jgi:hypothetical protein